MKTVKGMNDKLIVGSAVIVLWGILKCNVIIFKVNDIFLL